MVITMFTRTHHLCAVDTLISCLFRDNFGTVLLLSLHVLSPLPLVTFRYVDLFAVWVCWPLTPPQTRRPILFSAVRKCFIRNAGRYAVIEMMLRQFFCDVCCLCL